MKKTWNKLPADELEMEWDNRKVDVTWHCVNCEAKRLQRKDVIAVAWEMGVFFDKKRREADTAKRRATYGFSSERSPVRRA